MDSLSIISYQLILFCSYCLVGDSQCGVSRHSYLNNNFYYPDFFSLKHIFLVEAITSKKHQ